MLIVDDHELLADSLAASLAVLGFEVTRPESLDDRTVIDLVDSFEPDVVLLDLRLGEAHSALGLVAPIRDRGAGVVVVTAETSTVAIAECIEAGAIGVVSKSEPFDRLVHAVRCAESVRSNLTSVERDELLAVLRAHRSADRLRRAPFERLTAREQEVLAGLAQGLSADELAALHFVSITTVRSQIRSVLSKLGVSSQLSAVALAHASGWLDRRG
ncbi:MAG TPA: response regulator transcription factor [Acidimicrobiales bacterium]|nr:response regulator transcription factor [Acidimicrobiales bacterium]